MPASTGREGTEEALGLDGTPLYALHEIVHKKHVVDSLRERGVTFVSEISEVPEGATVIFSAHGVGQSVREEAESRRRVIDATCPLVAQIHGKRDIVIMTQTTLIPHQVEALMKRSRSVSPR